MIDTFLPVKFLCGGVVPSSHCNHELSLQWHARRLFEAGAAAQEKVLSARF